ncbi:hypothetical protein D3C81_2135680 [compost metagenome]
MAFIRHRPDQITFQLILEVDAGHHQLDGHGIFFEVADEHDHLEAVQKMHMEDAGVCIHPGGSGAAGFGAAEQAVRSGHPVVEAKGQHSSILTACAFFTGQP